MCLDRVSTTSR